MKQPRFAEQNYPCWRIIGRASSIALLGLWLAGLASQAMAQGQAPAQPSKEDCPTRPISGVSETGGVVVTLDRRAVAAVAQEIPYNDTDQPSS